MKIIKPHEITDAQLVSSTAVDIAPAAWSNATTYAEGVQVSVAGAAGLFSVYQSLSAGNLNHAPASSPTFWKWINDAYYEYNPATSYALDDRAQDNTAHVVYQSLAPTNVGNPLTDTTKWKKVGATVKWAAFDGAIGTMTITSSPLVMVIDPGATDGFGALEMLGREFTIEGTDGPGGPVVYSRTLALDGSLIDSFFDWFFTEYEQLTDLVLTDLPLQFTNLRLTITITSTVGNVGVGVSKPGRVTEIGVTQKGASVGIIDFSKKDRDPVFGTITTLERGYSKRGNFEVLTDSFAFNKIYKRLVAVRATPCFYVGTESLGFEPLIIYGFFRDFSIAIPWDLHHTCVLEVEGLTND